MMGRVTADDGAFRTAVEPAEGSSDGRPPRASDEASQAANAREDGEGPDEAAAQVAAAQGAAEVPPEVRAQDGAAAPDDRLHPTVHVADRHLHLRRHEVHADAFRRHHTMTGVR